LGSPGLPLEVWLLDRLATVNSPIRKLGEIPPGEWEAAAAGDRIYRFEI
jgi:hypothetical protein